jgi:hypothetical protein
MWGNILSQKAIKIFIKKSRINRSGREMNEATAAAAAER